MTRRQREKQRKKKKKREKETVLYIFFYREFISSEIPSNTRDARKQRARDKSKSINARKSAQEASSSMEDTGASFFSTLRVAAHLNAIKSISNVFFFIGKDFYLRKICNIHEQRLNFFISEEDG